jgi:galactoside O-acetyltransferase
MLQSRYLTEAQLRDFGFKSLGTDILVSAQARIYGPQKITLGNHVRIEDSVVLSAARGSIDIGSNVCLGRSVYVGGELGVEVHDFSRLAAHTVIYSAADSHDRQLTGLAATRDLPHGRGGAVVIGRHVNIGTHATIFGPARLGDGCSVGAMTLVRSDLQPWGIYAGIPARRIRERKKNLLAFETVLTHELAAVPQPNVY